MKGTQKALMARGIDSMQATKIANNGWTLKKLKHENEDSLRAIGLNDEFIRKLLKEPRPPIPNDTLMNVLFANRYQCCICRDPSQSIIVHHIDEWSISKSHNINNLAVLCLDHHDKAHSKKTLSQNLDVKSLQAAKQKWEEEVKQFDAEAILKAMRLDYSNWNFINELRVFEIAKTLGFKFNRFERFEDLVALGIVQSDGLPTPVRNETLYYMYEGPDILARYFYVTKVFHAVIHRLAVVNISDYLDKGTLGFAVVPGDFIFVQGAHTFSPTTNKKSGQGRSQICEGVRKANGVEVRFTFDRWEATSSSAKTCWLMGTRNQGSLIQVKDLSREGGRLIIRGTVLGICSNLGDLKTREYAQSWLEWIPKNRGDADKEDDWWGDN